MANAGRGSRHAAGKHVEHLHVVLTDERGLPMRVEVVKEMRQQRRQLARSARDEPSLFLHDGLLKYIHSILNCISSYHHSIVPNKIRSLTPK